MADRAVAREPLEKGRPMWFRWVALLAVTLPVVVAISFAWRGYVSRLPSSRPNLGLVDGRLVPCPESPNCVCSQDDGDARVAPLRYEGEPAAALRRLWEAVERTGGEIDEAGVDYLRARYVSTVFGFVDDVEFLVEPAANVIHVRSASREGYSDLGANRKRVERIRATFERDVGE